MFYHINYIFFNCYGISIVGLKLQSYRLFRLCYTFALNETHLNYLQQA